MNMLFSCSPKREQLDPRSRVGSLWLSYILAPCIALLILLFVSSFIYNLQRSATIAMNSITWLMPYDGMHQAELFTNQTDPYYRWTFGDAHLTLPNPGNRAWLRITIGGRPGGTPGSVIHVGAAQIALDIPELIRHYYMLIPPSDSERIDLQLVSPTEEIAKRPLGMVIRDVQVSGAGYMWGNAPLSAALLLIIGYVLALRTGRSPWLIVSILLPILVLTLLWHAMFGWRYGLLSAILQLTASISLATLAYEQIRSSQLGRHRAIPIVAAALVCIILPWLIGLQGTSAIVLIGHSLCAMAVYTWLRGVDLPMLPLYGGVLVLSIAILVFQEAANLTLLSLSLSQIGFSLSWLVLNAVPRKDQAADQPLFTRLSTDSAWILLAAAITITIGVHFYIWQTPVYLGSDIYTIWHDSMRIVAGQNPYMRILHGNMQHNDKYSTYFPLFYLLGALVHIFGLETFNTWVGFWKIVFLACDIGVATIIFLLLLRSGRPTPAWVGATFWLLSRWTLLSSIAVNIDFLAIFFLILALALIHRYQVAPDLPARLPWGALLSLSVSLAIKQIAIFMVPLFVIWFWNAASARARSDTDWRQSPALRTALAFMTIFSLPFLFAIPFLVWDAKAFILSILFSATRDPNNESIGAFISEIIPGFTGITSRLPLLLMLLGIYIAAWRRQVPIFSAGLLVMSVFVNFNIIYYVQYTTWVVSLTPLLICDFQPIRAALSAQRL